MSATRILIIFETIFMIIDLFAHRILVNAIGYTGIELVVGLGCLYFIASLILEGISKKYQHIFNYEFKIPDNSKLKRILFSAHPYNICTSIWIWSFFFVVIARFKGYPYQVEVFKIAGYIFLLVTGMYIAAEWNVQFRKYWDRKNSERVLN